MTGLCCCRTIINDVKLMAITTPKVHILDSFIPLLPYQCLLYLLSSRIGEFNSALVEMAFSGMLFEKLVVW